MAHRLDHHIDDDCCRDPPASQPVLPSTDKLRVTLRSIGLRLQKWRQRQALLELSDHLLEDIGITREIAEREAAKW